MTERYKNLQQFLSGYFHEDWGLDGETDADIVTLFVNASLYGNVRETLSELDDLILNCRNGRQKAEEILSEFFCYYYYQADNLNGLEWLVRLRGLLDEAVRAR